MSSLECIYLRSWDVDVVVVIVVVVRPGGLYHVCQPVVSCTLDRIGTDLGSVA